MSAEGEIHAAMLAALAQASGIAGVASGVFDLPPARAAFPYVAIGAATSLDWSHKTGRGREHRLQVSVWDEAGRTARLHALMGAAGDAIETMGRTLPGHRIVSLVFIRSRVVRDPAGPWAGVIEHRARTLEL